MAGPKTKAALIEQGRTFLQKACIIENYLDAKTANPALSQDQFGLDYGLSQGTLSKWLQKSEFIFIQARVFSLDVEREKEAVLFEELRRTQEITDFYDLVNSPEQFSSRTSGEGTQTLATKSVQSKLNPV